MIVTWGGVVSCTNNQIGTIKDNIVTIENVTNDTTCTVNFASATTTLYTDGTLIINESPNDRNNNITTHGVVTNEYDAMSDNNSYVFELTGSVAGIKYPNYPWFKEKSSVKKVEIGQVIKPISTAYWTAYLENMESGDFTNLDTSDVTDMEGMFLNTGTSGNIKTFNLIGVSGFDVSSVTNMLVVFAGSGKSATTWNIGDLSNWNVSNVTEIAGIFSGAALNATSFNIGDLSNWDVSNVTDMTEMFSNMDEDGSPGQQKEWHVGNISNWNTQNVTSMSNMFARVGYNADDFNLDLSGWNTSNVTDMSYMFYEAGYTTTNFNLNLSSWDMSSVETIDGIFEYAGNNATTWSITIPKTTGSLTNTIDKLYGSSSSTYTSPDTGRSFTLAS